MKPLSWSQHFQLSPTLSKYILSPSPLLSPQWSTNRCSIIRKEVICIPSLAFQASSSSYTLPASYNILRLSIHDECRSVLSLGSCSMYSTNRSHEYQNYLCPIYQLSDGEMFKEKMEHIHYSWVVLLIRIAEW